MVCLIFFFTVLFHGCSMKCNGSKQPLQETQKQDSVKQEDGKGTGKK